MATLSVTATGSTYLTVTIDGLTYYEYKRRIYWLIYDSDGDLVDDDMTTISATLDGASTSYTFEGLDPDSDYSITVFIYGNDSGSYAFLSTLSTSGSTASSATPYIKDTDSSYLQGTVTINTTVYCSDEDLSFYVIISDSSGDTIYDYSLSSSRSKTSVTIDISFDFEITGSSQLFYIYLCPLLDTSDYYVRKRITVYVQTRKYFSWDSNALLSSEDDVTDSPISSGDPISDYLTVKKWALLQECVNDVYEMVNGIAYDFTTVTTSTAISASIFNEMRSAIRGAGAKTAYLPSTVSSGDAIEASLFNKLQTACNSISV